MHKSSYLLHHCQVFLPYHHGRNFASKEQVELADLQQYSREKSQFADRVGHHPGMSAKFELIVVSFVRQCMNGIYTVA